MANRDHFLLGDTTTTDIFSKGSVGEYIYSGVVDITKAMADGKTINTTDVLRLLPFEEGTRVMSVDAVITEALSLDASAGAVDFGNTIASATDPDDYVDNQSTTAVGRFGAYASFTADTLLTADGYIALRLTGDKLSDGTADATGKIAWTVKLLPPVKKALGRNTPKTYTNS